MKIVTIVGARPQFIKAAVVSHAIGSQSNIDEVIIHTGQHFDHNMSALFFEEMDIPAPHYNLGVSGGSHAEMVAKMMMAIEPVLASEQPDMLLLYGDTNSTLAGALTAAKMQIPIAHVEAGPRSHSLKNVEEINRVCTDHLGSLLFAATEAGMRNLENEGLSARALLVGDTMYDAYLHYTAKLDEGLHSLNFRTFQEDNYLIPEHYCYLTCHRAENSTVETLSEILLAVNELFETVVYPVHPRVRAQVTEIMSEKNLSSIHLIEPVGYLESLYLVSHAEHVITDSGGVQREAFFAEVPCTVPMILLAWPEIMVDGRCEMVPPNRGDIIASVLGRTQLIRPNYQPFGNGNAAQRIVDELVRFAGEC